jgi:integrase/recombinase XerD
MTNAGGYRMKKDLVPIGNTAADEQYALTPVQFGQLAEVPAELEWLANLTNPKTRRAYKIDVGEFSAFAGLRHPAELRVVTRAHIIAWRKHLESRNLAASSIRRKLSALSSLFDYLCERNAVAGNPVDGVKRPAANGNEGSTPALGDSQARKLLDAPPEDTLKGLRDRAILATLLYHGVRCEELCRLRLRDLQSRQGVMHFRVHGKRSKIRFIPMHVTAQQLIEEYLALAGHGDDAAGPVFRPVANNRTKELNRPLDPDSVYHNIVHNMAARRVSLRRSMVSACIHCAQRLPPTRSTTRPISPRSRNGLGMPMCQRRASTTGGRRGRKIARLFGFDIKFSSDPELHAMVYDYHTAAPVNGPLGGRAPLAEKLKAIRAEPRPC